MKERESKERRRREEMRTRVARSSNESGIRKGGRKKNMACRCLRRRC